MGYAEKRRYPSHDLLLEAEESAGGAGTDSTKEDCSVTARICKTVLSLPMHPYMTKEMVEEVTEKIKRLL